MKVPLSLFAALLLMPMYGYAAESAPDAQKPADAKGDPSPAPPEGVLPAKGPGSAAVKSEMPQAAPPPVTPLKSDPTLDLIPAEPGQIMPEPTLTPDRLDQPDTPIPGRARAKPKASKTEAAEQELTQRIHFRQAKTKALEDPAVQAEWQNSLIARTDLQKREAMARYYTLLFARMVKIDPSIAKMVGTEKPIAINRLKQFRLAPTQPLSAEETSRRGIIADPFTPDQF